jgi:hypothetical protein
LNDFPSPIPPLAVEPARPARRSYRWLIFLAAALILAGCAGGVAVLAMLIKNLGQIPAGTAASQKVIDQFMQAGVAQDVDAAYALFSKNSQETARRAKVEQLFGIKYRFLFSGYQRVEIDTFIFHSGPNLDGNLLPGTVANIEGILHYQDGRTSRIDAILEQQDGGWKIYDLDIHSMPDRNNGNLES